MGPNHELLLSQKPVQAQRERQEKIDEKILAILSNDPGANWNVAWSKVWIDQNIRGLAKSRNTIEKYARIAYNKNNLSTPLIDKKLR